MSSSDIKARKLVKEGRVIEVYETNRKVYYAVKGTKLTYQIIYDKERDTWDCPCNNIRLTNCYHILGCTIIRKAGETGR